MPGLALGLRLTVLTDLFVLQFGPRRRWGQFFVEEDLSIGYFYASFHSAK
jgi:hypothetical protein